MVQQIRSIKQKSDDRIDCLLIYRIHMQPYNPYKSLKYVGIRKKIWNLMSYYKNKEYQIF